MGFQVLLYINDFARVSHKLYCVLFADDSNVLMSVTNLQDLLSAIQLELSKLLLWLQDNKLTLQLCKTH